MEYTQIHVSRITRTIIEKLHELDRDLPDYGEVSNKSLQMSVSELLSQDSILQDELEEQYNEVTGKFGCPFSVEEALILAGAFNASHMEQFVSGDVSLERAVEICFERTFWDAMAAEYGKPEELPGSTEEPELKVVKN